MPPAPIYGAPWGGRRVSIELFRHFHTFASCTHDRVYLLNNRFDLFDIQVHGAAAFEAVLAAGRGAFLIGAHLGSFEVVRAVGRHRPGLRVAMVMYEENARQDQCCPGRHQP